jgi:cystathionine gamma-synthase
VLHSATKYLAGHHDVLLGAVVSKSPEHAGRLQELRTRTGIVAAPDAAWLLLRGLKTLEVRVNRQSETAGILAKRLEEHEHVKAVRYPGFGGMLSFDLADGARARRLEVATKLIVNATSLGGVQSTIETRHRWEGDRVPEGLLRLSVGLEAADQLWLDLTRALEEA